MLSSSTLFSVWISVVNHTDSDVKAAVIVDTVEGDDTAQTGIIY